MGNRLRSPEMVTDLLAIDSHHESERTLPAFVSPSVRKRIETNLANVTEPHQSGAEYKYHAALIQFCDGIRKEHPRIDKILIEMWENDAATVIDEDMINFLDSIRKLDSLIDEFEITRPSELVHAKNRYEALSELRWNLANHKTPPKPKDPFKEFLNGQ